MTQRMGRRLVVAGLLVLGFAGSSQAAEGSSYADGMWRKLGRGITNIATSPAELIRTPSVVSQRDGNLAGWSVGIVQGAWRGVLRLLTGVFEVGTFYAEVPDNFEPLMKPEYVWLEGSWAE